MIRVEWEKSALSRHEEWAFNIAHEFTFKHAQSYLNDIENAVSNISAHPQVGTSFSSPGRPNLRRLVSGGGYSVFYNLDSVDDPAHATIISVTRGSK